MDDLEKLWERLNARALEQRTPRERRKARRKLSDAAVLQLRNAFTKWNGTQWAFCKMQAVQLSCHIHTVQRALLGHDSYAVKR